MSRILELFAGIGAWRAGWIDASLSPPQEWTAIDINNRCVPLYNLIEKKGARSGCQKTGEHKYVLKDITTMPTKMYANYDVWMMSPPCQPFTQQGNKQGAQDARSSALFSVLKNLSSLEPAERPGVILVENVEPFLLSTVYLDYMLPQLTSQGYKVKELILSPLMFEYPNNRRRCFIIASRNSGSYEVDSVALASLIELSRKPVVFHKPVGAFTDVNEREDSLLVSSLALDGQNYVLDPIFNDMVGSPGTSHALVCLSSNFPKFSYTKAFTKNYPRYLKGTGSVLQTDTGHFRFFTPNEIARMTGWGERADCFDHTPYKQGWSLLGNSIPLCLVTALLSCMREQNKRC